MTSKSIAYNTWNSYSIMLFIFVATIVFISGCGSSKEGSAAFSDYPIQPIPFTKVSLQDEFWSKKIRINHEVTIPIAVQKSSESGRIDNFKVAAGLKDGSFCSIYPFDDSDVYKIIEAASYSIQVFPDPDMELMLDSLIDFIAAAQEPDGYLYTNRTIGKPVHEWAGSKRWELVHDLSHELYNLGHLYEAAVAHYQATGKRTLLDVAIKSATLVDNEFGEGKIEDYPGHQEIEIGLIKLFRITGEKKYLDLAKFFLDVRGREGVGNPKTYDQSHIPVIDQREAVGHSVRAAYMWTAMADVAAITGDNRYITAIEAIWHDVLDGKYYINGGIGATGNHEGFSVAYDLPNMSAYCETCAGVGNALWNHRMFLMTGESKYIDVLERSMYNNILDGVSLSGDHFFYPNPLESNGQHARQEWFGCACCPPNVARFLPSMPGYIYARQDDRIYVNLYIASEAAFSIGDQQLELKMTSEFPWQGKVSLSILQDDPVEAMLLLRVPGYVAGRPVPSDLYEYLDTSNSGINLLINGENVDYEIDMKGYIELKRTWDPQDRIDIQFPFVIRKTRAHPNVAEDRDKISIERGPLLYCAEWPDSESGTVLNMVYDPDIPLKEIQTDALGGIITLHGEAKFARKLLNGTIETGESREFSLIPYHVWNNRGKGQMRVWLPTDTGSTIPEPAPTIAFKSTISVSNGAQSVTAIVDQIMPSVSGDQSVPYFHWWPQKNSREWVELNFEKPETIQAISVYWYDDGPHGGCRVPDSWEIHYRNQHGEWTPVNNDTYPVAKDQLNRITFEPVKAYGLKLTVDLPEEYSAGIHEIEIF